MCHCYVTISTISQMNNLSMKSEPKQGGLCVTEVCHIEKQAESWVVLHGDKKRHWGTWFGIRNQESWAEELGHGTRGRRWLTAAEDTSEENRAVFWQPRGDQHNAPTSWTVFRHLYINDALLRWAGFLLEDCGNAQTVTEGRTRAPLGGLVIPELCWVDF